MKYTAILLGAVALFLTSQASQAQLKLGTVDMNRIFAEYYKTKEAETKLNEARNAAKAEFDERLETLKKGMESINSLNAELEKPELSPEKKDQLTKDRDAKVNEARNLDREIAEFRSTRERQLQEQFVRMRKDIVEDILKTIADKVKSDGYDLVLDKSGQSIGQVPVVIFARDTYDFSNDIIATLNKNAPKKN